MEKHQPFEDVSPLKNGDVPAGHLTGSVQMTSTSPHLLQRVYP